MMKVSVMTYLPRCIVQHCRTNSRNVNRRIIPTRLFLKSLVSVGAEAESISVFICVALYCQTKPWMLKTGCHIRIGWMGVLFTFVVPCECSNFLHPIRWRNCCDIHLKLEIMKYQRKCKYPDTRYSMLTMNRRKIIHMTSHRGNQGSQDFTRPFCQQRQPSLLHYHR